MQVEYEEPIAPPPKGPRVQPITGDENSDEEEEEEEEPIIDESGPKQKQKRVIKQRQSLAEKERGTTIWPMARIKKIVKADKELDMMTGEATFMVAVATEYFVKHFMEEGYTKARLEKRRIVSYKDMASVVSRSEEFDFLKDLFPSPIAMSEALQMRKQKQILDENPTLHEDIAPPPGDDPADDLTALIPSTNPLYPNAVVKKPPNTHAKTSSRPKAAATASAPAPVPAPIAPAPVHIPVTATAAGPSTPRIISGKNAPSTPHSLTTRGSARRSLVPAEAVVEAEEKSGEDERMDQD